MHKQYLYCIYAVLSIRRSAVTKNKSIPHSCRSSMSSTDGTGGVSWR